jgi:hypothetical protein
LRVTITPSHTKDFSDYFLSCLMEAFEKFEIFVKNS